MTELITLRRTGLKQRKELERVLGVSFPTVNGYINGKSYPRGANRRFILNTVKVLNELVDRRKLPLPLEYDEERRAQWVERLAIYVRRRYKIKPYF